MKDVPKFEWHEDDDRERVTQHAGYLLDRLRDMIGGLMAVQDEVGEGTVPGLDEIIVHGIIADEQASGRDYGGNGEEEQ